jgi:hypothetical protein
MHVIEFRPKRRWIGWQHENVPDRKLLILEPLSSLRVHLIVGIHCLILRHHIEHIVVELRELA